MSKTLYVPDHVAQKIKTEKAAKSAASVDVNSAYVDPKKKILDPTLIEKPLIDRLPQPTGWRVLVMPYQGREKTDGGLLVPDHIREREALATVVAYVLKVGPLAYLDPNKFGDNPEAWCKEGEWVCVSEDMLAQDLK